ncbi:MAG: OmpA family protein, partial [Betaproteobacteria bacterium]
MHPGIPILLIGALIALIDEEPSPAAEEVRERIVLLPDAAGHVGGVSVTTSRGSAQLERAYAAADVFADGKVAAVEASPASVGQRFGAALEALPPAPSSFLVYFVFDQGELTAESLAQFDRIKAELARRPAPEVVVIGHTDRIGSARYNDALALKRAEVVRAALIDAGIDAGRVSVAGRGEREPLVSTEDEVT